MIIMRFAFWKGPVKQADTHLGTDDIELKAFPLETARKAEEEKRRLLGQVSQTLASLQSTPFFEGVTGASEIPEGARERRVKGLANNVRNGSLDQEVRKASLDALVKCTELRDQGWTPKVCAYQSAVEELGDLAIDKTLPKDYRGPALTRVLGLASGDVMTYGNSAQASSLQELSRLISSSTDLETQMQIINAVAPRTRDATTSHGALGTSYSAIKIMQTGLASPNVEAKVKALTVGKLCDTSVFSGSGVKYLDCMENAWAAVLPALSMDDVPQEAKSTILNTARGDTITGHQPMVNAAAQQISTALTTGKLNPELQSLAKAVLDLTVYQEALP